jgi:thiosulfate reductase/polysulfide reductase chain A
MDVKPNVCHFCHNHCAVEVTVKDGWRVEGMAANPRHFQFERQKIVVQSCQKARNVSEWFHHPDRLSYPKKRVGEKGEGKWQQISWSQAFDEIAAKLEELREKYGAETLATSSGTYRTEDQYRVRFMNLFGSPNRIGQSTICFAPSFITATCLFGQPLTPMTVHPKKTRCILSIGENCEQAFRHAWLTYLAALHAGAKLICIDPRRTPIAERADIWLQLRPGTDTALLMAMADVIIKENLYDKEFVDKWVYGFDKVAERAAKYPPEIAEKITWVPAEKIKEAARMYATLKPASSYHNMGLEHLSNSIEACHVRYILPAITGNIDIRGGNFMQGLHPDIQLAHEVELGDKLSPEQEAKQIGIDKFRLLQLPGYNLSMQTSFNKISRCHMCLAPAPLVYRAMITGNPYPVRALIVQSSNPMVTQSNIKQVYKALKSLDLLVVMDFWPTPTAELADYLLPAACWIERPVIFNFSEMVDFADVAAECVPPQVEGRWDRRTDYDFWRELGIRLGQEEHWPWKNLEEACDSRLVCTGRTIREWVAETGGNIARSAEMKKDRKYEERGFGTPTGRVEVYSTIMEKLGYDPLPEYYEPTESPVSNPELAKEYPLILITGARHQPFFHSEHRGVTSIRKLRPWPEIQIHPDTAQELNIADGDWVWIETSRGRIRQVCRYFTGIDPRVVSAQHGWWFPELPGEEPWLHGVWESNINVLTGDDDEMLNKKSGGWPLRALMCKVYKAQTY